MSLLFFMMITASVFEFYYKFICRCFYKDSYLCSQLLCYFAFAIKITCQIICYLCFVTHKVSCQIRLLPYFRDTEVFFVCYLISRHRSFFRLLPYFATLKVAYQVYLLPHFRDTECCF